jgi:predicted nuclease with TOPRIM domain
MENQPTNETNPKTIFGFIANPEKQRLLLEINEKLNEEAKQNKLIQEETIKAQLQSEYDIELQNQLKHIDNLKVENERLLDELTDNKNEMDHLNQVSFRLIVCICCF